MNPSIKIQNIFVIFVSSIILLMIPSSHGFAALHSNMIKMDTIFGFNHTYTHNSWTPLTIIVENKGPSVAATLQVLVKQGNEFKGNVYQTIYSTTADLPSGSKKAFHFNVLLKSQFHPLRIQLKHNNRLLFLQEKSLRNTVSEKPLLLIVRRNTSNDFYASMPDRFKVVVPMAEYLPRTWYGYGGVSQIIMEPAILKRLTDDQIKALEIWIKNGGFLVTSGSINYGIFSDKRIRKLLGLKITGLEKFRTIPALEPFSGFSFTAIRDLWVTRANMDDGKVLVSQNQFPLIFMRPESDGKIVFISFDINDPLFLQWKGQKRFWEKISSLHNKKLSPPGIIDQDHILTQMMESSKDTTPTLSKAATIIILYLALMLFVLSMKTVSNIKLSLKLTVFGLIVSLFSGISFALLKQRTDFNSQVSILKLNHNNTRMMNIVYHGFYSPQIKLKQVRLEEIDPGRDMHPIDIVFLTHQTKDTWLPCEIQHHGAKQSLRVKMNRYSIFHIKTNKYLDSGFQFNTILDGSSQILKIENYSDASIKNGLLYFKDKFYMLGDILSDQVFQKIVEQPDNRLKNEIFTYEDKEELELHFTKELTRMDNFGHGILPRVVDSIHRKYQDNPNKLILIGWYVENEKRLNTDPLPQLFLWDMT